MVDHVSAARSAIMRAVKSKDTDPEMRVRKAAHALGLRFRLHQKDLPGRPDMVLRRHRTVVLVHGCFWHRHPNCSKASSPRSNAEFWSAKFSRNVERDASIERLLTRMGWRVVVIWECETKNPDRLRARLRSEFFLELDDDLERDSRC